MAQMYSKMMSIWHDCRDHVLIALTAHVGQSLSLVSEGEPMSKPAIKLAKFAADITPRNAASGYPEPFASRMGGRKKRQLGNVFGISNFGVNMTELAPGGQSSVMHSHSKQDEFIYILSGTPTLVMEDGEQILQPGMCVGFPANGVAHHLVNGSDEIVLYLEVGDRTPGDEGHYPEDDLRAVMGPEGYVFTRKDGTPYE
jgi:uncharacterized cupin superfamily protein